MTWELGRRGRATNGEFAGHEVFIDSVDMTLVDPLAVLISPQPR